MTARRIEGNFNQGWGVAAFVTLMVVAAFTIAFMVNRRTHYSPNDVLAPSSTAPAAHAPAKPH